MKLVFTSLILLLFSSCSKSQELTLEIISKEVKSLELENEKLEKFMTSEDSLYSDRFKNLKTVLTYKLTNNTNKTYFFNTGASENIINHSDKIRIDKSHFTIFQNNKEVKVKKVFVTRGGPTTDELKFWLLNNDNNENNNYHQSQNFIIHPNETLYFEYFVVLPFSCLVEDPISIVELAPDKKYEIELGMTSLNDSKAKKYLSRTEIETIKENGYEIFNGTITSKNRIPIKFVN